MSTSQNNQPWFQEWFDSPYYHLLYNHRDDYEARIFIDNIVQKMQPSTEARMLDLACGRGRHAVYLHNKGYEVAGLDLSPRSIAHARKFEEKGLQFSSGDMRNPYGQNCYDYILNLFTSFGYFESLDDNCRACQMIKKALKPGGVLLLDFMNIHKVKLGLVEEEVRCVEGIEFHIRRKLRNSWVIKEIFFEDKGRSFYFEEKVQLLELEDFEHLFFKSGLKIDKTFGDYHLNDFDKRHSERLILKARA